MGLFVKFWGTRGSIPTPGPRTQRYGGNTSCVEIRAGDTLIVCDGGTGLRELGVDLERRFPGKPLTIHLFFSHPHWDHIQGFPFFHPAYEPIHHLLIHGVDQSLYQLLSGQMQSAYFPVNFAELKAQIRFQLLENGQGRIDDVQVAAFAQRHPGGSIGLSFTYQGKKVVYATDSELDPLLLDPEQPVKRPEALRQLPAPLVDAARGAHLLIADGQYQDREYEAKAGWGHSRASTAVDLAVQCGAKQLALFHHDPMQSDPEVDEKIAACAARARQLGSSLEVFGAREGVEIKIA